MKRLFTVKTVKCGDVSLDLELFSDPDREFFGYVDDEEAQSEAPEAPLHGCLWPSAEGLAQALLQERASLAGQQVLEIGCGLAFPSLVASFLGAEVTATDHHPEIVPILEGNCARNSLRLEAVVIASFTDPNLQLGKFPLIVGSDILYEPQAYPALEDFILRHAASPCTVVIADPGRYASSRFGESLRKRGQFTLTMTTVAGHEHPIELHRFVLP